MPARAPTSPALQGLADRTGLPSLACLVDAMVVAVRRGPLGRGSFVPRHRTSARQVAAPFLEAAVVSGLNVLVTGGDPGWEAH